MAKKAEIPLFPKTIGASIDLLYTLRDERLLEEKKIEALKQKETALADHIMANFASADIEGARGNIATASITRSTQADVTDWDAYVRWAAKKDPSAVQRRVGITALREHWDNGEKVPGVQPVVVEKLSVTKAGGR